MRKLGKTKEPAMETNEKNYSEEGMREGHPGTINPNEVNVTPPSKNIKQLDKEDIEESGLGRDTSYKQAEEFIADPVSQTTENPTYNQAQEKLTDTEDEMRLDHRDPSNSIEDWDAEKNRTGRHK